MDEIQISYNQILGSVISMHDIEVRLNGVVADAMSELKDVDGHWSREISKNMQSKLSFIGNELISFVSAVETGGKVAQKSVEAFRETDQALVSKNGMDGILDIVHRNEKLAGMAKMDCCAECFWSQLNETTDDAFSVLDTLDSAKVFKDIPIVSEILSYKSAYEVITNYRSFSDYLQKVAKGGDSHDYFEAMRAGNKASYGIAELTADASDPLMGLLIHFGAQVSLSRNLLVIDGLEDEHSFGRILFTSTVKPFVDLKDDIDRYNPIYQIANYGGDFISNMVTGNTMKENRDGFMGYVEEKIDERYNVVKKVINNDLFNYVANPGSAFKRIFGEDCKKHNGRGGRV